MGQNKNVDVNYCVCDCQSLKAGGQHRHQTRDEKCFRNTCGHYDQKYTTQTLPRIKKAVEEDKRREELWGDIRFGSVDGNDYKNVFYNLEQLRQTDIIDENNDSDETSEGSLVGGGIDLWGDGTSIIAKCSSESCQEYCNSICKTTKETIRSDRKCYVDENNTGHFQKGKETCQRLNGDLKRTIGDCRNSCDFIKNTSDFTKRPNNGITDDHNMKERSDSGIYHKNPNCFAPNGGCHNTKYLTRSGGCQGTEGLCQSNNEHGKSPESDQNTGGDNESTRDRKQNVSSAPIEVEYYDICLGYLVFTLPCVDFNVCIYSFQRNKQLMESVITPLTGLPQLGE